MGTYVIKYTKSHFCEICGKLFWSNKSTARYCCNACKQKAYRQTLAAKEEARRRQTEIIWGER